MCAPRQSQSRPPNRYKAKKQVEVDVRNYHIRYQVFLVIDIDVVYLNWPYAVVFVTVIGLVEGFEGSTRLWSRLFTLGPGKHQLRQLRLPRRQQCVCHIRDQSTTSSAFERSYKIKPTLGKTDQTIQEAWKNQDQIWTEIITDEIGVTIAYLLLRSDFCRVFDQLKKAPLQEQTGL